MTSMVLQDMTNEEKCHETNDGDKKDLKDFKYAKNATSVKVRETFAFFTIVKCHVTLS